MGRDGSPDIRPDVRGISHPKTVCLGCFPFLNLFQTLKNIRKQSATLHRVAGPCPQHVPFDMHDSKGYPRSLDTKRLIQNAFFESQTVSFSGLHGCLGKDVWDFQAKSASSGSCPRFLHFIGKIALQRRLGKRLEVPDILLPEIRGLLIPKKDKESFLMGEGGVQEMPVS